METIYRITEEHCLDSVKLLLKSVLQQDGIDAILVPLRSKDNSSVIPFLVSDPGALDQADPLSPSFQLNSARLVSKLTKKTPSGTTAVFLRPCELKALIELVKIKQAKTDDLMIISSDCAGAFSNHDFNTTAKQAKEVYTHSFIEKRAASAFSDEMDGNITTACRICTNPFPEGADIAIRYMDLKNGTIDVTAQTEKGKTLLDSIALETARDATDQDATDRDVLVETVLTARKEIRGAVLAEVRDQTPTLPKLSDYLSSCVNCYNCRVACPVCFCNECVFNTDVVNYEPFQYSAWSKAKGALRMPVDTVFFHLTRMVHMGLSCVGCGQCSNACPNNVPLAELFIGVGEKAQQGFDYHPGRSIDDVPPLSVFFENEFQDVTGI